MTKIQIQIIGFLTLLNLKMKRVVTVLSLLLCEQVGFFDTFFDVSSMINNGCILLVLVAGSYFYYWLVTLPSLYCNMRCKCYSNIWCASNSVYCTMRCKWYSCIFNSLLYSMSCFAGKWYNKVGVGEALPYEVSLARPWEEWFPLRLSV